MKKEQYSIHASLGLTHWWHYGTKMLFQRLVRGEIAKGAHILDVGCGVGDMILLLKDNYCVTGIDYSEDAVKFCVEKGIKNNIIRADMNNLPFENGVFEAVLSLDVLYHRWIPDDFHALKNIYRILKPGGKFFVQLPAYNWLMSGHDEAAFSSRRYTTGRLSDLLNLSGFSQVKVKYRISLLFPIAVIRRIFFRGKGSEMKQVSPVLNFLFKTVINFENFIIPYINFPFGLSVIGVAQK